MNIHDFTITLAKQIEKQIPSIHLINESAFERYHIATPAWELSERNPDIRVFVHPESQKKKCLNSCDAGVTNFSYRVKGCPDCWAASKKYSVTDAFGTRSNFDLIAIDENGRTLAIECKWLSISAGKRPNGEFQRFVGQCVLASTVHDFVIGVCGFRDQRTEMFHKHDSNLQSQLKERGIFLIPLYAKNNPQSDPIQVCACDQNL